MNIATYYSYLGKKVCIVDTDVNQSSFNWFEKRRSNLPQVPIFLAPSLNSINLLLPILIKEFDLLVIDGTPSNSVLNNYILGCSEILVVPFLPSPIDWEVTKKIIDYWENLTKTRYTQLFVVINQSDSSTWSKEYAIVLKNIRINARIFRLKKSIIYK